MVGLHVIALLSYKFFYRAGTPWERKQRSKEIGMNAKKEIGQGKKTGADVTGDKERKLDISGTEQSKQDLSNNSPDDSMHDSPPPLSSDQTRSSLISSASPGSVEDNNGVV